MDEADREFMTPQPDKRFAYIYIYFCPATSGCFTAGGDLMD
jgi:hypothetical protein